jgi:hypothetical protein
VTNSIILTRHNEALARTEDIYWLVVHEYISARKSHHGNSNGVQRKHESKSKGHYQTCERKARTANNRYTQPTIKTIVIANPGTRDPMDTA